MADMNTKKTALQLLVMNGILTEQEAARCIEVLAEYNEIKSMAGRVIYEDDSIIVSFKNLEKIGSQKKDYAWKESTFEIGLDLYNKTDESFEVSADDICFNGGWVSDWKTICTVPAREKREGTFSVSVGYNSFMGKEPGKDVENVEEIEEVKFYILMDYGKDGMIGH